MNENTLNDGLVQDPQHEPITNTSQIQVIQKDCMPQKFIDCNVQMLSTGALPYYGEFNLFINFIKAKIGTCGVNVSEHGMNFYWDEKFVDSLKVPEATFILIHEDFHLLFDHMKRSVGYDKQLSNVAQDMIINQIIHDEIIMGNNDLKKYVQIPKDNNEFVKNEKGEFILDKDGNQIKNPGYGKNIGLFLDKSYTGEPIFENVYEWLRDKQKEHKENKYQKQQGQGKGDQKQQGQGKGDQKQQGQGKGDKSEKGDQEGYGQGDKMDSSGKPAYGPYGKNDVECSSLDNIFDGLEQGKQMTLDSHLDNDVPDEAKKNIVDDIINKLKNRGLETGDIERILRKLRKSKKDYLKQIKRTISSHTFGTTKVKSITKPNRRGVEGIKGRKKHKNVINCLLDTSGSMSGDFEKVLAYIFQNDIHINMIQCDTEVKASLDIKSKRDLNKMGIKGLGGTTLQPGIDYIANNKNKLSGYNTVILTDGATDSLNFANYHKTVLIISTGGACPISVSNGKLKQITIDKKDSIYSDK